MLMHDFFVYLAGGLNSVWRGDLEKRWESRGVQCIDPFRNCRQSGIYAFTNDDLDSVRRSSLIFGYCDYHKHTGMALEFGFAHALGIPIVFVTDQPRIDSMMAGVAKAVFTDLEEAIQYCEKRGLVPEVRP